jgi:hypothetical protein
MGRFISRVSGDADEAKRDDKIDEGGRQLLGRAFGQRDAEPFGGDGDGDGCGALQRQRVRRAFLCGCFAHGLLDLSEKPKGVSGRSD